MAFEANRTDNTVGYRETNTGEMKERVACEEKKQVAQQEARSGQTQGGGRNTTEEELQGKTGICWLENSTQTHFVRVNNPIKKKELQRFGRVKGKE